MSTNLYEGLSPDELTERLKHVEGEAAKLAQAKSELASALAEVRERWEAVRLHDLGSAHSPNDHQHEAAVDQLRSFGHALSALPTDLAAERDARIIAACAGCIADDDQQVAPSEYTPVVNAMVERDRRVRAEALEKAAGAWPIGFPYDYSAQESRDWLRERAAAIREGRE